MTQDRQLQLVTTVMITAGFEVSEKFTLRPRSFDLIARNNSMLLVIKVVSHIDSVSETAAFDLEVISRHLNGIPLIVGERAREAELERGAVYVRYGIFAISVSTLYDYFVEKIPPLVYASPGGLYVNINGKSLRELREGRNMSLGDLGQVLGVSRRTISKYESGMGTTLDVAIKIEEYFDAGVVESIDLTHHERPEEFRHDWSPEPDRQKVPIEYLEHLTGYGPAQKVVRRAALIGNLSKIAKKYAMCIITDYHKQKKIGRTLVIGEERLHRIEDGFELLDMIGE
jgi:putative transcriptional regulator